MQKPSSPLATALLTWAALMSIVWALFTPRGLPVATFTMLTLTGPLLLLFAPFPREASRLLADRHS